ncbi:MAG: SGNH/GDSL hydrolase family protein [Methyloceanibacter sp.]|uniref:SGNH/GDSL hydrolase family protein n=1 Tax=Methyloceanibacter sp. TaxID=1965321 RepID=UPI003D6CADA2
MSRAASYLCSARATAFAALVVPLLVASMAPVPAAAQGETPVHRSYINPFPNGDRYRIAVFGDSLADGLWAGLYRAFEEDKTLDFIQRSKVSSGFARPETYDWNAELDKLLKDETYQIAVVMFGANDSQALRKGKDWLKVGTDAWREVYGERVENFIKKLRAANIAVYWVGLPVMRSPEQSQNAEQLNDVYREKAFVNGAKFIDTWNGFVDESGRYSAYGPDMTGQSKRLRADDGFHFTMRGYLKLAHFVEKELRKDLTLAKEERNIPLAGDENEQAKVSGLAVAPQPAPSPIEPAAAASAEGEGAGEDGEQAGLQESQVGDVSVVRPTLTAPQVDTLASPTTNVATTEPEVITTELPGGFTAVATISAVTDLSLSSSRPLLPLSQRPYYKVLIRGEQLEPKSGRADDFAWPPG